MLKEPDIYQYFGSTYGARGDSYQRNGHVLSAGFDKRGTLLSGQVQGTRIRPYKVEVRLEKNAITDDRCSCPMGGNCKHGAALLFHALRTGLIHNSDSLSSARNIPTSKELFRALQQFEDYRSHHESTTSKPSALWLDKLSSALPGKQSRKQKNNDDQVVYLLDVLPQGHQNRLVLNFGHAKQKDGEWGSLQKTDLTGISTGRYEYCREEDSEIATLILQCTQQSARERSNTLPEIAEISQLILEKLLASKRCFWRDLDCGELSLGPAMEGTLFWQTLVDNKQVLTLRSKVPGDIVALAGSAWYVNPNELLVGPLALPVPVAALKTILSAPAIDPVEALAVSQALAKIGSIVPPPKTDFSIKRVKLDPRPVLTLSMGESSRDYFCNRSPIYYAEKVGKAVLTFDYDGAKFEYPACSEYRTVEDNKIVIYSRNEAAEASYHEQLTKEGLKELERRFGGEPVFGIVDGDKIDWLRFRQNIVPQLESKGWQVTCDKSFKLESVTANEEWSIDTSEGSDFWFSLDLGIMVDGKRVALLPIIYEALRWMLGEDPIKELEKHSRDGVFYAPLASDRYVTLPFSRVKAVTEALLELFAAKRHGEEDNLVSLPQVAGLAKAIDSSRNGGQSWSVGSKFATLMQKIKEFDGLEKVACPPDFDAQLRPYQLEGLSWLNFLRHFGLGGILADDMGLGKTVETLAHVCLEKACARLNKPFLVVCPTSVLPNWLSEINKFAPHLKVTELSGPNRANNFDKIADSDLVLTTYPLVKRDFETLQLHQWQAIVLDEAQMIKNANTQTAQAVCKLKSDYRFCLTGTPVENHLGELWSQFNFLMPGFLADLQTFTRNFRRAIEKDNDKQVQKILSDRVRPFLLRRTKELVAKELPEKTIIMKKVELEGAQRDLYETVRLAMHEKVKGALASRGLEKSQIIILDALLKLRQVCCDPRLVSIASAKRIASTAKLDLLLEMLEELLDEGKSILVFSQFTSMLDLIIPELDKRHILFAQIRGDTRDRAAPVESFQKGAVKVFLLSLKAGGFGLNLTAADTVIHYDPWWNPAVENQATDRAHRIGQTKSVFVFKLIAAGTIEERMLELQERKKAIAGAVYGDENSLPFTITAGDLEDLFKPIH